MCHTGLTVNYLTFKGKRQLSMNMLACLSSICVCLKHACQLSLKHFATDEILSGNNLFISSAAPAAGNSYTSHVSGRRGRSAISSFADLPEPEKCSSKNQRSRGAFTCSNLLLSQVKETGLPF